MKGIESFLRRTAYGGVLLAITLYVAFLIGSAFIISQNYLSEISGTIAKSVYWTSCVGKDVVGEYRASGFESSNLLQFLTKIKRKALETGLVNDAVSYVFLRLGVGNGSWIGKPECVYKAQVMGEIGIMIEDGIRLAEGYAYWSQGSVSPDRRALLKDVTGLPYLPSPPDLDSLILEVNNYFRVLKVGGKSYDALIPYSKYLIIIDASNGKKALRTLMSSLSMTSRECGYDLIIYSSWAEIALRISPTHFLGGSIQASIPMLSRATKEVGAQVGLTAVSIDPVKNVLGKIRNSESGLITQSFLLILPLLTAAFLAVPYMGSVVRGFMKLHFRIMTLRGASMQRIKELMLRETLIAGGVISSTSVLGYYLLYYFTSRETAPVFLVTASSLGALTLLASLGVWWFTSQNGKRVKLSMSKADWILLIVGLALLAEPHIEMLSGILFGFRGLEIASAVIEYINPFLNPLVAVIVSYSVGKLMTVYMEDIIKQLTVRIPDVLKYSIKTLGKSGLRRAFPALFLIIISLGFFTGYSMSSSFSHDLIMSSVKASVGGEFIASKDILVNSSLSLYRTLSNLSGNFKEATVMGVIDCYLTWLYNGVGYGSPASVVFIFPTRVLKTTYWNMKWGGEEGFPSLMREVSSGKTVVTTSSKAVLPLPQWVFLRTSPSGYSEEIHLSGIVTGFPGMPQLTRAPIALLVHYRALISEEWKDIFEALKKQSIVGSVDARIYVVGVNESYLKSLKALGFQVFTIDEIYNNPELKLFILTNTFPSLVEVAGTLTSLLACIAIVAATYYGTLTSLDLALLLNRRGLRWKDIYLSLLLTWGIASILSVVIGISSGALLGFRNSWLLQSSIPTHLTLQANGSEFILGLNLASTSPHLPALTAVYALGLGALITALPPIFTKLISPK